MTDSKRYVVSLLVLAGAMFAGVSASEAYNLLPKHFSLVGINPVVTGFIMSFTGAGSLMVLPFLAAVVDRFRAKTILAVAAITGIIVPLVYFLPLDVVRVYAIPRAFQGALFAVMMVSYNAVLGRVLPEGRRSRGIGMFGLMGQAGGLVALAVGELVLDSGGLSSLYVFSLLLFGLMLICAFLLPEARPEGHSQKPQWSDFRRYLWKRSMFLPLFWVFSLGSGFGTILAFMPDLVLERGIGVVRPFYLAYPAAVATVRLGFGHLFDRHSLPRVVLLPLAMLPACMIFIWQADSWLLLAAAGAAYGIAHGVLFPALMGYLMDNSPPHFRGRMSLVFNMCFSGGIFGAANIGGLFVDGSVQPVFFWMALYTAAGLFLLAGRQVARLLKA